MTDIRDMTIREVMKMLEKPIGQSHLRWEIQLSHNEIALARHIPYSSQSDIRRHSKNKGFEYVAEKLLS